MAEIPDVIPTTGTFGPTDDSDVHPITEDIYSKGGHRSVADETAREAISTERRKDGMMVYQIDTALTYQLQGGVTNSDWFLFSGVVSSHTHTEYTTDAEFDTHTGTSTIHFTVGSIDHGSISGLADDDHPRYSQTGHTHTDYTTDAEFDTHTGTSNIHFTEASLNLSQYTTDTEFDTHTGTSGIHFTEGSIDHTNISNVGSNTHTQIDNHITSGSVHFTEDTIDIDNIISGHTHDYVPFSQKGFVYATAADTTARVLFSKLSAGTAIDLAVANPSSDEDVIITVEQTEIDIENIISAHTHTESEISDLGTYATESQHSTHTGTSGIHFTEASIDHGSIAGLADDDHPRYSQTGHSHAYSEITSTGHTHVANDITTGTFGSGTFVFQDAVRFNDAIYINYDDGTTTSDIFFHDGATSDGASIKYEQSKSQFEISHTTLVKGDIYVHDAIYVNYNDGSDDSNIYFHDGASTVGARIYLDQPNGQFVMTEHLAVGGDYVALDGPEFAIGANGANVDTFLYFGHSGALNSFLKFDYSSQQFELTESIDVTGSVSATTIYSGDTDIVEMFATRTKTKGLTLLDPVADDEVGIFYTDIAITISQLNSYVRGASTPSVTVSIYYAATRSGIATTINTATITSEAGVEDTSMSDGTVPADNWVYLKVTAQSGTVDEFHVTMKYTED